MVLVRKVTTESFTSLGRGQKPRGSEVKKHKTLWHYLPLPCPPPPPTLPSTPSLFSLEFVLDVLASLFQQNSPDEVSGDGDALGNSRQHLVMLFGGLDSVWAQLLGEGYHRLQDHLERTAVTGHAGEEHDGTLCEHLVTTMQNVITCRSEMGRCPSPGHLTPACNYVLHLLIFEDVTRKGLEVPTELL